MLPVVEFNVPVDRNRYSSVAQTLLAEHEALLADPGYQLRREGDGVSIHTRELPVVRVGEGAPVQTSTLLTRATFDVLVSRERAFALVGDPTRGPDWDPLDRGHEQLEAFDADHVVMRTFSKPPPPWGMRESVLFMVKRRPDGEGPWDFCARAVTHPACPPGAMPRVLQQVYGWRVTPLGPTTARVTGLASVPENLLPQWLLRLANVGGWFGLAKKLRGLMHAESA